MSLHGSPRYVRSLVASLLMVGLVVIAVWTAQQRPSTWNLYDFINNQVKTIQGGK